MQAKSKVETFIGFAVRANKYRTGMNSVETLKRANLVLVCSTASENTKKQAVKIAKKYHAKILVTIENPLSFYTHKDSAKIMAITDKALAEAILNNSENEFIEIES
jgi:hypothetical protein